MMKQRTVCRQGCSHVYDCAAYFMLYLRFAATKQRQQRQWNEYVRIYKPVVKYTDKRTDTK